MLPEVSMMNTTYSLSTGMPPTSFCTSVWRSRWAWSRFISSVSILLGGEHAAGHDVLHLRQLAAGLELALEAREIALQPGHRHLLGGQLLAFPAQRALQQRRLAADLEDLPLQPGDASLRGPPAPPRWPGARSSG